MFFSVLLAVGIIVAGAIAYFALPQSRVILAQNRVIEGPVRVIDGDTIVVAGEHVRLNGVDAEEVARHRHVNEFGAASG